MISFNLVSVRQFIYLLLLWIFLSPALLFAKESAHQELEAVSLRLQWKHQFEFAGFYAAIEQGYYRDAGFAVTLHEFDNSVNQIEEVVNGTMEFGIWGEGVLQAFMEGQPVQLLANYFKHSPLILVTQPELQSPADLRGKRLMISTVNLKNSGLLQMLTRYSLSPDDITQVLPSFDINDFINGSVDAYLAFATNEPFQLQQQKVNFNILSPANYGADLYDVNLFTSRDYARRNPEGVFRFIEASNRGWEYALSHPEEIIDLIQQRYNSQHKSREALHFEYQKMLEFIQPNRFAIGSIDYKRLQLMGDLFAQRGIVQPLEDYHPFIFSSYLWRDDLHLTAAERTFILNHPVIRVHNEKSWAPLNFNYRGQPSGYSIDLLNLLFSKLNLRAEYVTGPSWEQFLQLLEQRQIDIVSNMAITPDRQQYTLYS
ncbi:MAG: ABC transporter substrate-binding protein, partial [Gammaproteobacteria bacterium]|nr:ABC transporter substrate-binding protein [Gammaproteobacteria bacterium]